MVRKTSRGEHVRRGQTKGERTRAAIVASAAELFNVNGFAGTSMSDVLAATGLEKGGIYNHFPSKDDLAVAAFDHAAAILESRHRDAQDAAGSAPAKLRAVIDVFETMVKRLPIAGGCPLLNTAVEATDVHPRLRSRAAEAFGRALGRIERIVNDGIAGGEFTAGTDARATASLFFAALEGAVMLSRLHHDPSHMQRVAAHLQGEIVRISTVPPPPALAGRT